jgi:gamma-glutamylcyclotransferase (GGCT)/AIG2-like uncharacterized protein YtfP
MIGGGHHARADGAAQDIAHVFLYGTLMRGEPAWHRLGLATALAFVCEAGIEGVLYDLGGYPALVPGEGRVPGELFRIVDPAVLAAMDAYEVYLPERPGDSDYLRRRVRVAGLDAWVYVYRLEVGDAPRLPSGWRARG